MSNTLGESERWMYASSTSRMEPLGLFSSAQAMSFFAVSVPVGLFGLQM